MIAPELLKMPGAVELTWMVYEVTRPLLFTATSACPNGALGAPRHFLIAKAADGTISRTCTGSGGGCPSTGSW